MDKSIDELVTPLGQLEGEISVMYTVVWVLTVLEWSLMVGVITVKNENMLNTHTQLSI